MPYIRLESGDGVTFRLDAEAAKASTLLNNIIEAFGVNEEDEEPTPLPRIKENILKKIIQWMEFHHSNPGSPSPSFYGKGRKKEEELDICPWDQRFLELNKETLFELLIAVDFMDIDLLRATICRYIAKKIQGMDHEEIRGYFNLHKETTQEGSA